MLHQSIHRSSSYTPDQNDRSQFSQRRAVIQTPEAPEAQMDVSQTQKPEELAPFTGNFTTSPVHALDKPGSAPFQPLLPWQRSPSAMPPPSPGRAIAPPQSSGMNWLQKTVPVYSRNPPVPLIQAKLSVGQPDDRYEQEADRLAAQVVNQIDASQSVQPGETIQKDNSLQMKPALHNPSGGIPVTPEFEAEVGRSRNGGQTLPQAIRRPIEQALEADFSQVRVHTDTRADQLNRSIDAQAFTTGQNLFFRQGSYHPESSEGKRLLTHELTHVVQQGGKTSSVVQPNPFKWLRNKWRNWRRRRNEEPMAEEARNEVPVAEKPKKIRQVEMSNAGRGFKTVEDDETELFTEGFSGCVGMVILGPGQKRTLVHLFSGLFYEGTKSKLKDELRNELKKRVLEAAEIQIWNPSKLNNEAEILEFMKPIFDVTGTPTCRLIYGGNPNRLRILPNGEVRNE